MCPSRLALLSCFVVISAGCQCGPATVVTTAGGADSGAGRDSGAGTGGATGTGGSGGMGGATGTGGGQGCQLPGDCPPGAARCDLPVGRCVACLGSGDCPASAPACDPGTGTCGPACKSSASCSAPRPVCDPLVGTCIEAECQIEGACVGWRRGPWGPCRGGTCQGGGTRTREVVCLDGLGQPATGCPGSAPSQQEACTDFSRCAPDAGGADAGAPDAGGPDAGLPPFDGGSPALDAGPVELCAPSDAGPLSSTPCHATVRMVTLNVSSPSCYVDVAAHPGDTAELYWDCGLPHGRAELRFATLTAVGAWNAPSLSVCFGTHFPWSDGCRWQSAQAVEGTPTPGATLQFTYTERPDPGQTGCMTPCTADGTFVVQ